MTKVSPKVSKEVTTRRVEETIGSEKNRPVKTFRDGDVSASVWKRTIVKLEPVTYWSISVERSYQNAKGEWKYTSFFNPGDGQKLNNVWQQALDFIDEE